MTAVVIGQSAQCWNSESSSASALDGGLKVDGKPPQGPAEDLGRTKVGVAEHSDAAGDATHRDTARDAVHSDAAGEAAHSDTRGDAAHRDMAGDATHRDTAGDAAHSKLTMICGFMLVYGLCTFNCILFEAEQKPIMETLQPAGSPAIQFCSVTYLCTSIANRWIWMLVTSKRSALWTLAFSCALYSISAVCLSFLGSRWWLLALVSVAMVAFTNSTMSALVPLGISRLFSKELAARIYVWSIVGDVLGGLSPPLAAAVSVHIGWVATLLVSAAIQVLPLGILLFVLPRDVYRGRRGS